MANNEPHNMKELNPRSQSILSDLVDLYTESAEPVGSKTLVETSKLNLSPATVRGVMSDLEKKGFLASPHTSAGRIPTEEGFRYYAKNLITAEKVNAKLRKKIDEVVSSSKDINVIIKDVSHTIGEMTGCAGLVSAPTYEQDPLEKLEFVRLSGDKVLAVMVYKSGKIENRVIDVPAFVSMEELNSAATQLKDVVDGETLGHAKDKLVSNIAEKKKEINTLLDNMMAAADEWGQPVVSDGALVVAGSTNLFMYPELVRDQLKGLVQMFEERRMLMALLEEVQKGEGVQIFVGADAPLEVAKNCSIVASTYGTEDKKIIGTLGVVGPMRMNYKQTVGLVDYTSRLLSQIVSEQEQ